jgi:hypothetical protein
MEAWQATLLGVAIRIVYDSGREVLNEILSRKRAVAPKDDHSELEHLSTNLSMQNLDELLHSTVTENQISKHSQHIEHLSRLFELYKRNYRNAKEKAAMWGATLVPPIILHEIEDAEDNLVVVIKQLREAVALTLGQFEN